MHLRPASKANVLAFLILATTACAHPPSPRSPLNQVFQWSVSGANDAWPEASRNTSTLYLWIPEQCRQLRGLVILGANVPEHMLAGHASIRQACTDKDLGIVWAVPTFWNFRKECKGQDGAQVAFLERLLQRLADISGYGEVASVPWIPVGESGHLLMVCGLIDQRPDRCIAAICVKNPHEPQNKTVPLLWTLGTAQEWGQAKKDIRTSWRDTGSYVQWGANRAAHRWPLSIVIEHGTGHFYCSEPMADYFARYIDAAVLARLPDTATAALQPVDLNSGVLANLPIEGQTDLAIIRYAGATEEQRKRPWFFNEALAKAAQRLSEPGPATEAQFASIEPGEGCRTEPFALNSVTKLFVKSDGGFTVKPVLLESIPEGFVGAGEPLARSGGAPVAEWICGPFAPSGEGRFRIAPDRTWTARAATYLIVKHEGDDHIRRTVQPVHVTIEQNDAGAPQDITFAEIPDVVAGTESVKVSAASDSGLPVSFFVAHGPATVEGDTIRLTPLPPRAKFPIEVAVTAWQWGRSTDPQVRTAKPVTRTFHLTKP